MFSSSLVASSKALQYSILLVLGAIYPLCVFYSLGSILVYVEFTQELHRNIPVVVCVLAITLILFVVNHYFVGLRPMLLGITAAMAGFFYFGIIRPWPFVFVSALATAINLAAVVIVPLLVGLVLNKRSESNAT